MRTLKFIVDHLIVRPDPSCDFDNLIPGTEGYLVAEFTFAPEWNNCAKVVEFSRNFKECEPQVLKNGRCIIPADALVGRTFKIRVIGKRDGYKLITNKLTVKQNGGRV